MTDLADDPVLIEGPDWAPHDLLDVRGGLFPLSVENHFIATIAKLLPGTTTVTTLARYYSLHTFLATVAEDKELEWADAVRMLRRAEIVVAGATIAAGLPPTDERPHGYDTIFPRMDSAGFLDVAGLAERPGGYSDQRSGFLAAYIGSENDTGLISGNALVPGPRADREPLRKAFAGLLDLSEQDQVSFEDLRAAGHLSINTLSTSPDGPWLSRVLCGVGLTDPTVSDKVRNDTAKTLARALTIDPAGGPLASFRRFVMYGPALTDDPVGSQIAAAQAWRGCLYRHESVGAWRILWHWIVNQIDGETAPHELAAWFAAELPSGTVQDFLDNLPATTDPAGNPLAAEDAVRDSDLSVPAKGLAVLALGARRLDELTGRARDGFSEKQSTGLSPVWVQSWLDERRHKPMADAAADLIDALLHRSQFVAFRKMRVKADGTIWLPTRVHERNGLLYRVGSETARNVGVRLEQYARILTSLGVLTRVDGQIVVSDSGTELLGMPQ